MFKLIEHLLSPSKNNNSSSCKDKDKDTDQQSSYSISSSSSSTSSSSTPTSNFNNGSPLTSTPLNQSGIINDCNGVSIYGHNINHYRCEVPIDNVIKILILGGLQVGKTSLIRRYLQDIFTNQYIQTIGVDLNAMILQTNQSSTTPSSPHTSPVKSYHSSSSSSSSSLDLDGVTNDQIQDYNGSNCNFVVQFWDIAYPEIKGKNISQLIHGTSGIILVFDSTNASSIVAMDECRAILKKYGINNQQTPIAIFANKSDCGDPVINLQDLDNYCKSCGFNLCRFTSTRKDVGVKDGIDKLLELVLEIKKQEIEEQQRQRAKIILKQQQHHHHHHHKHKLKSRDKNHNSSSNQQSIVSQSLPNIIFNNNNGKESPRKQQQSEQQHQKNNNNNNNNNNNVILTNNDNEKQEEQQRLEILKIQELQNYATEHYVNRFGKALEELLQKSVGARYNDISMLEKQRNQEYIKICNSLKKLLQSPLQQHIRSHVGGQRIIVTREMIQRTLEENVKKWTRLIDNLILEMSLEQPSSTTTAVSSSKHQSSKSNRSSIISSSDSNISTSSSSSSLSSNSTTMERQQHQQQQSSILFRGDVNQHHNHPVHKSNPSISLSVSYQPSNQHNNSSSGGGNHHSSSKHHHNHHHHHHHNINNNHRHNNNNWKMGFGFRNNGKSSGIAFNNGNYSSVDTDNPVSSSSTISSSSSSSSLVSSSSTSSSPIVSPSTSPINHPSPSILPSSYNLTFQIPPSVKLSSPPLILTQEQHLNDYSPSSPTN